MLQKGMETGRVNIGCQTNRLGWLHQSDLLGWHLQDRPARPAADELAPPVRPPGLVSPVRPTWLPFTPPARPILPRVDHHPAQLAGIVIDQPDDRREEQQNEVEADNDIPVIQGRGLLSEIGSFQLYLPQRTEQTQRRMVGTL